jgi:phytoene dehydrogenase-like protein
MAVWNARRDRAGRPVEVLRHRHRRGGRVPTYKVGIKVNGFDMTEEVHTMWRLGAAHMDLGLILGPGGFPRRHCDVAWMLNV